MVLPNTPMSSLNCFWKEIGRKADWRDDGGRAEGNWERV